jgi:hypothetical protein
VPNTTYFIVQALWVALTAYGISFYSNEIVPYEVNEIVLVHYWVNTSVLIHTSIGLGARRYNCRNTNLGNKGTNKVSILRAELLRRYERATPSHTQLLRQRRHHRGASRLRHHISVLFRIARVVVQLPPRQLRPIRLPEGKILRPFCVCHGRSYQ